MEVKWTPWRMDYIAGPREEGCVLCRVPAEQEDRENLLVYRGKCCYVLLNLYPYNNGHLLVAPYDHVADLPHLAPDAAAELIFLAQKGILALRRALSPHGFNLGMNLGRVAGAGIAGHLHLHIVPRWQGDANFMPLIAGTKLIPELLGETYEKVRRAFEELENRAP